MGNIFAALSGMFNFTSDKRLLMLGLDAAGEFFFELISLVIDSNCFMKGKTTVLYKMRLGETVHTIPTIGKCRFFFRLTDF